MEESVFKSINIIYSKARCKSHQQSMNQWFNRSINKPTCQLTNHPIDQATNQPTNQWLNDSMHRSVSKGIMFLRTVQAPRPSRLRSSPKHLETPMALLSPGKASSRLRVRTFVFPPKSRQTGLFYSERIRPLSGRNPLKRSASRGPRLSRRFGLAHLSGFLKN